MEFRVGRRVALDEVARETGIGRTTLTRIAGNLGHSTSTETLDNLCEFFDCRIEQLIEYVSSGADAQKP
ncbi:helix-turn-helix domain-containing protein [Endothiovibrio diazotrophicus]